MQRLELTWIGKGQEPEVEPRILLHDPSKDYGDPNSENMLIHGDNLLALKALEQQYAGQVKCIYIDPPYNTGAAFEYYDDNLEHSIWLGLMYPRIKLLYSLLKDGGSLWVSIDDIECHYRRTESQNRADRTGHTGDARALYPDASLADLYDELTMPPELRTAHQQNDRAVMQAYGFSVRDTTESTCVAALMKMYQQMTEQKG